MNKIITSAKVESEEKAAVNFQLPKSLREELLSICEENNITLTSIFKSLAQDFVTNYRNPEQSEMNLLEVVKLLTKLEKEKSNLEDTISKLPAKQAKDHELSEQLDSCNLKIKAIKKELERRSQ